MSSGSTRARIEDLTETQRRVLDLIAEGRTNYEIGQTLGITLDGAKYHVTEILNKLGVDSREEAAALVQPSASRWRRLPAKHVALAAAGAAAAIAILGILLALRDTDSSIPEVQVAFLASKSDADAQDSPRQITIIDSEGNSRTVGEPGEYLALDWAPTGRHLVAFTQRADRFALDIFDVEGGGHDSWEGSGLPESLEWSPDGALIALHDRPLAPDDSKESSVSILRPDGHRIAEAELPPLSDPGTQPGRDVIWSPDSEWILSWHGPDMTLLSTSGESRFLPTPDEFPGGSVVVVDWTAAGLRIAARSSQPPLGGPRAWILADPRGDWRPIDPVPSPTPASVAHEAVARRFEPEFRVAYSGDTSGGSGQFYVLSRSPIGSPSPPLADLVLVILGGREVTITPPPGVRAFGAVSAVVVQ